MASQKELQAGDLDRVITLLIPAKVRDISGTRILNYDAEADGAPCQFTPGKGAEKDEKDRLIAAQSDTFTIRYRPDIDPVWRLDFEGTAYDIKSVGEGPGRRQWTVITATKTDLVNPSR